MPDTYWHRQTKDQPLFPDLQWSRPENKQQAGKLLIIGGNLHGFAAAAEAYNEVLKAGIGTVRVLLPQALQKTVGRVFEAGEFAPNTPSGSFSRQSLSEWLAMADWADSVLIAGDLGHNSETAIVLEQFVQKYARQLTITKDAVDYFTKAPNNIINRPQTTLVLSLAQLQKIVQALNFTSPITFGMDLLHLIDALHEFTEQFSLNIVVKHLNTIFVAVNGQVSSTKLPEDLEIWRVTMAAKACVWWLQNPTKTFEALSTAIIESKQ